MKTPFAKLFEPGLVGTLQVANRIVKCPTISDYANRDDSVSERLLRYYEEVAAGGCGLVIVEFAYVDNKGSKPHANVLGITDPGFRPGLALLAQRIQENGAKAALQLGHAGAGRTMGPPLKAPSAVGWGSLLARMGTAAIPQELSVSEIAEIEQAFGDAAVRAKEVGFDMVEIHGAHGYLITGFLSPLTNKRADLYGGSLENRMRFLLRIIDTTRRKVGPGFPLSVRLTGTEYVDGGISIEETIAVAKALENVGVNIIHVSGGSRNASGDTIVMPVYHPEAFNVWAAEAVKRAVNIPVIASGAITTPELAENILEDGKADFIGMARPLIADPSLPRKAREGRVEDIVPCIRCNDGCLRPERKGFGGIRCTVNVAVGKEDRFAIQRVITPKRVAVVGGGPAGLEAARVAALSGHRVTLFEKRELGGHLIEAAIPEFKRGLGRLVRYYAAQMSKLGVEVVRHEATAADLAGNHFDAVIMAVGSVEANLDIPGAENPIVTGALDVLNGKSDVKKTVVVVGGGRVGCDVALFLAGQAREVTLVTRRDGVGQSMDELERDVFLAKVEEKGIRVCTKMTIREVVDDGAVFTDGAGASVKLAAGSIVLAAGFRPAALVELEEDGGQGEIRQVGDCVAPRTIFDAIHEGHLAARNIG